MKIGNIITAVKALPAKAGFHIKAHSPEILAVGGITAIVAGTVIACKQTPKAMDIIAEHRETLEKIDAVANDPKLCEENNYTEEDGTQDRTIVYIQTAAKLARTYAIPAVCIAAGIAMMLWSNNILKTRWLASAGAYEALNESIKAYRDRVKDEVGEEKENQLYNNVKAIDIQKDDKEGEMPSVEKKPVVNNAHVLGSPYAVIFDEYNPNWHRDASSNRIFITGQQNYANFLLHSRGYLYLDEVYHMLGYYYAPQANREDISAEQARLSRRVGWIDNKEHTKMISFGVLEAFDNIEAALMDGAEPSCILDFNVDGDIEAKLYRK